jgi:hypothetical protein
MAGVYEREVRDLPWSEYRATVVIEYRVRCPECGIRAEKVPPLPSKAPFSKRFRGGGRLGLRECGGAASSQAVWLGVEHGASHRPAVSERWVAGRKMGAPELFLIRRINGCASSPTTVRRDEESRIDRSG